MLFQETDVPESFAIIVHFPPYLILPLSLPTLENTREKNEPRASPSWDNRSASWAISSSATLPKFSAHIPDIGYWKDTWNALQHKSDSLKQLDNVKISSGLLKPRVHFSHVKLVARYIQPCHVVGTFSQWPCHVRYSSSDSGDEIELLRAWSVFGWETTWKLLKLVKSVQVSQIMMLLRAVWTVLNSVLPVVEKCRNPSQVEHLQASQPSIVWKNV